MQSPCKDSYRARVVAGEDIGGDGHLLRVRLAAPLRDREKPYPMRIKARSVVPKARAPSSISAAGMSVMPDAQSGVGVRRWTSSAAGSSVYFAM